MTILLQLFKMRNKIKRFKREPHSEKEKEEFVNKLELEIISMPDDIKIIFEKHLKEMFKNKN